MTATEDDKIKNHVDTVNDSPNSDSATVNGDSPKAHYGSMYIYNIITKLLFQWFSYLTLPYIFCRRASMSQYFDNLIWDTFL